MQLKKTDLHLRPKETPVIKGLRTSYRVGDLLNVNCSTSARDAQLKWFLNDEQLNANYLIPYGGLHQANQSTSNQVASASYESLPHHLSNVYYNNGLVAHALKRRTFSIQNTFTTPIADNQRLSGVRRSLASNNINSNPNGSNSPNSPNSHQSTYANLNHQLNSLTNGLSSLNQLDDNQILGLQMPLLQQHFQVDVKLKCVAIMHKQVAQLEQSLKIITENHDLTRMSQSSVAYSIVRK